MFPLIAKRLDRMAIRSACLSVRSCSSPPPAKDLEHPDYFSAQPPPASPDFYREGRFRFPSPVKSGEISNDTVYGRFVTGVGRSRHRKKRGAVILLHGWNGEGGYRLLFPVLARRFARLGLSVAMMELPYHGTRKPRSGRFRNFLSGDIGHMMKATQQAIGEIRAMTGWLEEEGHGPVTFWGMSLGAWLGALTASADERLSAGVLVTPVPRIDQAVESLEFCRHIRASMEGSHLHAGYLNLKGRPPKCGPENILIVESLYDQFAPADSVEELWRSWNKPEMWRVKHGHISVLLSPVVMEKTVRWLSREVS